jgi:transcription elongation factor Elf1
VFVGGNKETFYNKMGRRKKAVKKVVKRKKYAVAKVFKCLFCNHEKSVNCQMNTSSMTGELLCGMCGAKFVTSINTLSEPIDIFTEWLDDTSDLQAKTAKKELGSSGIHNAERDEDNIGNLVLGNEDEDDIRIIDEFDEE